MKTSTVKYSNMAATAYFPYNLQFDFAPYSV